MTHQRSTVQKLGYGSGAGQCYVPADLPLALLPFAWPDQVYETKLPNNWRLSLSMAKVQIRIHGAGAAASSAQSYNKHYILQPSSSELIFPFTRILRPTLQWHLQQHSYVLPLRLLHSATPRIVNSFSYRTHSPRYLRYLFLLSKDHYVSAASPHLLVQ